MDTLQREGRGRDECVCSQRKMLIVVDGGPKWCTKIVDQNGGLKWWTQEQNAQNGWQGYVRDGCHSSSSNKIREIIDLKIFSTCATLS